VDVHLPKGTRDFLPDVMRNRQRVMDRVRAVFGRYGFQPLETPAFERIETLTGKYGNEGEKLMFRILARGEGGERGEVDLALRYDLTVPLARVIAMHPELTKPFKRYQMQPVWRADRPQHGRFREFWQCDVDVCGSESPMADAECLAVVHDSLVELGFANFTIRLNDRRILADLAAAAGATTDREEMSVLIALDKLDKVGRDGVNGELSKLGFTGEPVATLWRALDDQGGNEATLAHLDALLHERGRVGVAVLRQVLAAAADLGVDPNRIRVDPALARGLDYYTGPVFETVVTEPKIGSISGGGRYDELIGMFGRERVPSVGVSLGLERITVAMEELGMLPATSPPAQVFVTVFHEDLRSESARIATVLRRAGVSVELFLGEATNRKSMTKQLKYAGTCGYPYVVVLGPDEVAAGVVRLKQMATGEQRALPVAELAAAVLTQHS